MASGSGQKVATQTRAGLSQPGTKPIVPKDKICRAFARNGKCRDGENCKFLHRRKEPTYYDSEKVLRKFLQATSTAQRGGRIDNITVNATAGNNGGLSAEGSSKTRGRHRDRNDNGSKDSKDLTKNVGSCHNFKVGKCTSGDKCQFRHDLSRVALDTVRIGEKTRRLDTEEKVANEARKHKAEVDAWLARETEKEKTRLAAEEAIRVQEAKKLRDAQEAAIRQDARDKAKARLARLAEQDAIRIEREAAVTTQHVVLESTLVTFGAGLEVRSVVSGFESCRLIISDIPSNAKPHEIVQLFTQQGMSCDDVHVELYPSPGNHLEAKVLTSTTQGGVVAVGLDGIEFRNELLKFEVGDIVSSNAMGESSSRQANALTITWYAPSVSMIATYATIDFAREHQQIIDKKILSGRRIKAEMNRPPTGPALRHYTPSAVKITGIPLDTPVTAIMDMAGTQSVRAIKSNSYDLQDLLGDLRRHLHSLPGDGITSIDSAPDREDGLMTLKVQFKNWEDANNARTSLEDKRLHPSYPTIRLSLPPSLHFTSTIPVQQYDAQKRLWDTLAEPNGDKGPRVHINRIPNRNIVTIRLSGDDKKLVGALKVRVETLAAGEKLGATYWHRSFLWVKGRDFLSKIFSSTNVYARSDFKTQSIKIYGDGEAKGRARRLIEEEVTRLAQQEWTVLLKRQSVGYFVRKGLAALKEILGEDAVSLDLASTPCKLTFRGGEEARHALDNIMAQSVNDVVFPSSCDNDLCPICYDAVSNPVVLDCKHVYCTACIRHYFTSASESKVFPLVCMGDEAKCKVPIAIPTIQRFLIRQKYEHLVNVAFSTYLDQHPQDFRYCTTPDCTQIYRANTQTMLKCPSCFAEVCSSCHEEAHEGMTCEDRRVQKAQTEEQLNDRWATEHGVKRCPACSVYIEKTEGCNHMECRCGAHICWICVTVFSMDEIYRHLGTVHGGAFDGDGERRNLDLQHALAVQRQLDDDLAVLPPPLPHRPVVAVQGAQLNARAAVPQMVDIEGWVQEQEARWEQQRRDQERREVEERQNQERREQQRQEQLRQEQERRERERQAQERYDQWVQLEAARREEERQRANAEWLVNQRRAAERREQENRRQADQHRREEYQRRWEAERLARERKDEGWGCLVM
ncbi:hypothetical protein DXG01_015812 [Tephrocybe rancida]|nr:hypothetical protein DXG01_015812 [Tephrocybe rancida]